jgi:hypothetical protein
VQQMRLWHTRRLKLAHVRVMLMLAVCKRQRVLTTVEKHRAVAGLTLRRWSEGFLLCTPAQKHTTLLPHAR